MNLRLLYRLCVLLFGLLVIVPTCVVAQEALSFEKAVELR